MRTPDFDYSPEAFEAALGADVMDHIRRSVAAAPPPSPELIERLRPIFASVAVPQPQPVVLDLAEDAA